MFHLRISIPAFAFSLCTLVAQQVPRPAGAWTIQVPGAKPIALADDHRKPVLLAFILTTCPHCQHAVELLNKLQPEYAKRGVVILASAIDQDGATAVPQFLSQMHPAFTVGYNDAMAAINFTGYSLTRAPRMPILMFIDRAGVVRQQHDGSEQDYFGDQEEQHLRQSLDALLVPSKPAPRKSASAPSR